ncbi:MAG: hypothetical protein CVU48_04345 [Candidatus Cloacimonetes bacterium HGW-Cloacimonetes-1]|nr:MAG: hypothetical protein CVU48_04345 [Candidatus Cloacimonetes bacterium HGW-Cloacimonetes-1]
MNHNEGLRACGTTNPSLSDVAHEGLKQAYNCVLSAVGVPTGQLIGLWSKNRNLAAAPCESQQSVMAHASCATVEATVITMVQRSGTFLFRIPLNLGEVQAVDKLSARQGDIR